MKKIYLLSLGLAATLTFSSCNDFLDSENYTGKDTSNFPMTEEDVDQMVSSVYKACFYEPWQNDNGNSAEKYYAFSNMASDDMYGGGGQNDLSTQALDHLLYQTDNQMEQYWAACYSAISRANSALAAVDNIADEDKRNQTKGELLFLRAFTYFDLAKCFGNVPLMDAAPNSVEEAQKSPEQKKPEEVFKKVASDLYIATKIMPAYKYDGWTTLKFGQVSRWAAEALLARVYLYYTGFFGASSLPMTETEEYPDVTEVTKDYVVGCLEDIINNSGHQLLDDYRSLWPYANEETKKDYSFVSDLGEAWSEGNKEAIFSINYAYRGEWDSQLHMTNQYALFFGGPRFNDIDDTKFNLGADDSVYPFGGGWGCGPVTPNLVSDWKAAEPNDPRFDASILTLPDNYNYAGDHNDNWMENTGYLQKKMGSVRSNGGNVKTGDGYYSFCAQISWGGAGATTGHYQASHAQALVLLRYADVLLMHSELTETADGMNKVRARVGLPAVGYSLTALQNERRWELAFEGVRWDDIRRWGIAPECLAKQVGGKINNAGTWTTMKDQGDGYVARYNATKGYYKIPANQVALSNGELKQNAGWEGTTGYYGSWK